MRESIQRLGPLLGVLSFVISTTVIITVLANDTNIMSISEVFMGMFFLTFGAFKIYNLDGFKQAFKRYDFLADKSDIYATSYPLIEFTLGILYMAIAFLDIPIQLQVVTHVTAIIIMSVGAVGVLDAIKQGRNLECACLGNVFNVPMTKVTLAEDSFMALMALIMLVSIL